MTTLDEAWAWYRAAADGMKRLTHLAKFWGRLPWDAPDEWVGQVGKDNVLRHVEANQMAADAARVNDYLDDIAILTLFSVFEANVRDRLQSQLRPEVDRLSHPSLRRAGEGVLDDVEHGSFGRLLEAFKLDEKDKDLVAQVNQIRVHRNWVAHGRRPEMRPGTFVRPRDAYERLSECLTLIRGYDAPLAGVSTGGS